MVPSMTILAMIIKKTSKIIKILIKAMASSKIK